ncbi:MAG TPA: translation elongation factor Ts [Candidatus Gastranaerophilales bacterium]|nr:translation elongation factor Ts [Candidatus Gastranaerophilales bacterium]
MSISATQVKELRDKTGAGFMDAKKALAETEGNIDKAMELLRQKGIASAEKKMSRIASEGLIGSYIHNGKIGVMVEINCETDFVAKNEEFKQLVKDICLHIASSAPEYVSREEIPSSIIEEEKRIEMGKEDLLKKPENIREKIVQGRVDKLMAEKVLLEQNFVKDPSITIENLIKEKIAKIGEKITIRRFTRYMLGEGLEKRQDNFAEEVMKELNK